MKRTLEVVQASIRQADAELYRQLARSDMSVTLGSSETDDEQTEKLGRAIFSEYMEKLKPTLCSNDVVKRAKNRDATINEVDIITAVIDTVLTTLGAVPVLVLTSLIIKYGLDKICDD